MLPQIDQSGKIEDTSKDTVVACANHNYGVTVFLPAVEKRVVQEVMRQCGLPKLFVDITFALLTTEAIQLARCTHVEIDIEYPGHTQTIEKLIKANSEKKLTIHWALVGKQSPAHKLALTTFKKRARPTKIIYSVEILKKAIKIAGGYLNPSQTLESRHSAPAFSKKNNKTIRPKNKGPL